MNTMDKNKIYLFEYIPDDFNFNSFLNIKTEKIIALTPVACYQLEMIGIEYMIPEDFYYPKRIELSKIKIYDSELNNNAFFLSFYETLETELFWLNFVEEYKKKTNIDNFSYIYYGHKNILLFLDILENGSSNKEYL